MTEDEHTEIELLKAEVKRLKVRVLCLEIERRNAIKGVIVTLFGIVGTGIVYIWSLR